MICIICKVDIDERGERYRDVGCTIVELNTDKKRFRGPGAFNWVPRKVLIIQYIILGTSGSQIQYCHAQYYSAYIPLDALIRGSIVHYRAAHSDNELSITMTQPVQYIHIAPL